MKKDSKMKQADIEKGTKDSRHNERVIAAAIALQMSGGPAPDCKVLSVLARYVDGELTMHDVLMELHPAYLSILPAVADNEVLIRRITRLRERIKQHRSAA